MLCYNKYKGGDCGSLDMSEILLDAYHLADQINESDEVKHYLRLQQELQQSHEAKKLIEQFQKAKELYEETQRFGIFHPDYQEAKEKVKNTYEKLQTHPLIGSFLEAEDRLDQLLYQVSVTIAHAVSKSIKVPTNGIKLVDRKARHCQV